MPTGYESLRIHNSSGILDTPERQATQYVCRTVARDGRAAFKFRMALSGSFPRMGSSGPDKHIRELTIRPSVAGGDDRHRPRVYSAMSVETPAQAARLWCRKRRVYPDAVCAERPAR
jgi:hypothetical protein